MLQILIIVAALAIHASADEVWIPPVRFDAILGPGAGAAVALLSMVVPVVAAWIGLQAICVRAAHSIDHGDARAAAGADRAARGYRSWCCLWMALTGPALSPGAPVATWLEGAGLSSPLAWMGAEAALLAWLALILGASWWSFEPVERRFRQAILLRQLDRGDPIWALPTRRAYSLSQVRSHALWILVPVGALMALSRVLALGVDRLASAASSGSGAWSWLPAWMGDAEGLSTIVDLATLPLAIVLMPLLQRRVWETVPLAGGPLREAIDALCARARVRVRGTLVWRTHGLSVNAVVLGALPRFRYLIFTDALLEAMTLDHVRGVAAHEIGHLRRHHVLWLVLGLTAMFTLTSQIAGHLVQSLVAGGGLTGLAAVAGGLGMTLPATAWISRRFEWQADADAARLLTPPDSTRVDPHAAATVAEALRIVAHLNHADPRAFSWRHGSIDARRAKVLALADQPAATLPIDRGVGACKGVILAMWIGLSLWLVLDAVGT